MMDKIKIKNLEIFGKHGVFPEENALGQKFVVSATLYTDLRNAGKTDDLETSLDYGKICSIIKDFVESNVFMLIERVAEGLAEKLLEDNVALQKIKVKVKKPWAPVALHLETVSVEIERCRHISYIALGSNMGDRESYINFALSEIEKVKGCRLMRISEVINTAPYGYAEQDDFLNAVVEIETLSPPHELLALLQDIENRAGRIRTIHWGPRTLDLDILFYDGLVMSDDVLRIPHAQAHLRDFVLKPLCEIAPNLLHPIYKKTISELLNELDKRTDSRTD